MFTSYRYSAMEVLHDCLWFYKINNSHSAEEDMEKPVAMSSWLFLSECCSHEISDWWFDFCYNSDQ